MTTPERAPSRKASEADWWPARVLVGVVADECGVGQTAVHPPVDARQPGRDLVDDAMEVVDPRLQRDGEVDEIVLARAHEHELGLPHGAQLQVEGEREKESRDRRRCGADGDPGSGVGEVRHRALAYREEGLAA